MKKVVYGGALLLIAAALVGVGRSWSKDKPEPPSPRTRLALVNLGLLVSNYDKYKTFKKEMEDAAKPYQDRLKEMQDHAAGLKRDYDAAEPVGGKRDDIDKAMKKLQADMEKLTEEARKELARKGDGQTVAIYKEIRSAAERYAKAHDIEVVLHYNEPVNEADIDGAPNVQHKWSVGACVPLYAAPGVDITNEVLAALNSAK